MSAKNETKVTLYIDESACLCISSSSKARPDRRIAEIPISNFFNDPENSAPSILGDAILQHFKVIAPEAFANLQVREKADDDYSDYEVAHYLISQGVLRKTNVFNDSIDFLLREAAKEDNEAKRFLDVDWPTLRRNIDSSQQVD